ncbi:cytochrome c oxidase assembly protein [Lysinibacillus sp. KU-BSD001]|uniref:cytochrome c oxidase assembly protein n=1 Tax=Lysinibacillus sp. KU-BSD001 TaxID=3141328 RepID=UPI0036F08382
MMFLHIHHTPYQSVSIVGGAFIFLVLATLYIGTVFLNYSKKRPWSLYRILFWVGGVLAITFSIAGPLAEKAHHSFVAHMYTHLLLGMIGPLFIVLAKPMLLVLRTLPVSLARVLTQFLKSAPARFISHPVTATILNIGGLWVLYTTDLYVWMHTSLLVFIVVHVHIFLAGYVFTTTLISVDFSPHKAPFHLRAVVLIVAIAGHNILAKWIYANPPSSVERLQAEEGGVFMYYAGGIVEIILIILLCYEYYKTVKPIHLQKSKLSHTSL